MSRDPDGFLARWSLRKQASRQAEAAEPAVAAPAEEAEVAPVVGQPDAVPDRVAPDEAAAAPAAQDPHPDLPPVDDLDGESDYRPFLKTEVPKAVRLAALRKAWTTDPAIAAYRPLADYDWDFNAPGYAALRPTDDPSTFIKALFRHLTDPPQDAPAPDQPELVPDAPEPADEPVAVAAAEPAAVADSEPPDPGAGDLTASRPV